MYDKKILYKYFDLALKVFETSKVILNFNLNMHESLIPGRLEIMES